MKGQKGMTLLEVLIALTILALAGTSLLRAAIDTSLHVIYLDKLQYAQWAANELIVQRSLLGSHPPDNDKFQDIEVGPYRFVGKWKVIKTTSENVFRVNIKIMDKKNQGNVTYEIDYLMRE